MRWARALLAGGQAKPEEIAIAAASPAEWDDHFQALSEMAGIDLHFVHGRKAISTAEGQFAAALAEVLLRGFSQARMTRLIALLRSQNPDFKIVPGNWWRALPGDAPLLDAASWRDVVRAMLNPTDATSEAVVRVLTSLIETLAWPQPCNLGTGIDRGSTRSSRCDARISHITRPGGSGSKYSLGTGGLARCRSSAVGAARWTYLARLATSPSRGFTSARPYCEFIAA